MFCQISKWGLIKRQSPKQCHPYKDGGGRGQISESKYLSQNTLVYGPFYVNYLPFPHKSQPEHSASLAQTTCHFMHQSNKLVTMNAKVSDWATLFFAQ